MRIGKYTLYNETKLNATIERIRDSSESAATSQTIPYTRQGVVEASLTCSLPRATYETLETRHWDCAN